MVLAVAADDLFHKRHPHVVPVAPAILERLLHDVGEFLRGVPRLLRSGPAILKLLIIIAMLRGGGALCWMAWSGVAAQTCWRGDGNGVAMVAIMVWRRGTDLLVMWLARAMVWWSGSFHRFMRSSQSLRETKWPLSHHCSNCLGTGNSSMHHCCRTLLTTQRARSALRGGKGIWSATPGGLGEQSGAQRRI